MTPLCSVRIGSEQGRGRPSGQRADQASMALIDLVHNACRAGAGKLWTTQQRKVCLQRQTKGLAVLCRGGWKERAKKAWGVRARVVLVVWELLDNTSVQRRTRVVPNRGGGSLPSDRIVERNRSRWGVGPQSIQRTGAGAAAGLSCPRMRENTWRAARYFGRS